MLDKENKKSMCSHHIFFGIIATLLSFILIVLVFKTGLIVGSSGTNYNKGYTHQCDYKSKKATAGIYEQKAKVMGLSVEEFKKYLVEQKGVIKE